MVGGPGGGWRFPVGVAIFGVGLAAPLAIPLVVASEMPTPWKTAISGVLAVGVPEVMMLLAAAVMGKEGFAELKRRAGRIFARHGPPQQVSRTRYRVGLVMFVVPLLLGWLGPYVHHHLPGYGEHPPCWNLGGDLVFVAGRYGLYLYPRQCEATTSVGDSGVTRPRLPSVRGHPNPFTAHTVIHYELPRPAPVTTMTRPLRS